MDQTSQVPTQTENPAPVAATTEPVPTGEWPGAFKIYTPSKEAVKFNIGAVLGLIGLTILLSIASGLASPRQSYDADGMVTSSASPVGTVIYIVCQLLTIVLSTAMIYVFIAGVKRQKMTVGESLKAAWSKFLPFFGQSLLLGLIAIVTVLLFIIPAFIVMPRLALAPYYLLEGNLSVMESLKASWAATKGNVGKVWGIIGVNLLIALLCVTIIGIPFAIYFGIMYSAAEIILYFWLKNRKPAAAPAGPVIEQK